MIRPCAFCPRPIKGEDFQFPVGDGRVAHMVCLGAYLDAQAAAQSPPRRRWLRRALRDGAE